MKQAQNECQKNEHRWHLFTKENKAIRDTLGSQIKELTISLCHAKAGADRELLHKDIAAKASRVSPRIWEEKCHEVKDAKESSSYWKNQLEALHQDSSICD